MNLDRRSWHTRLFFQALDMTYKFSDRGYRQYYSYRERTNLCPYVRVICLYLPFISLLHLALLAAAVFALVFLPVHLFGVGYGAMVIGETSLALIITLATLSIKKIGERAKTKAIAAPASEQELDQELEETRPTPKTRQGPGFWKVIGEWLKARKAQICPEIVFYGEKVN